MICVEGYGNDIFVSCGSFSEFLWGLHVSRPLSLVGSSIVMETSTGLDPTLPLLQKDNYENNSAKSGDRSDRLTRRNSVNSIRTFFFSKLPDKVRSGLDSESPYDGINISSTTALSKGISLSLYIYVNISLMNICI